MSEPAPQLTAETRAAAHQLFSLGRVFAIAGNTFRDLVRQKVFYFMLVFALILIGASLALVGLSFQGQLQTVMDVSLGAISVFTMLLAVLSTAMLLPKDMEDRTLYTILAKPVARFEYLLGKLIGVALILTVAVLLMTAVFCVVLWFWQGREMDAMRMNYPAERAELEIAKLTAGTFTPTLFAGIGVLLLRAVVCATLTLMISCFASSWLFTVVIAFVAILIGHLIPIARSVLQDPVAAGINASPGAEWFLKALTVFFPDMQLFNVVDDIAVGTRVDPAIFANVAGLGAGYIAVYLLVAYLFFAWREL
jgi:ABC-type transport system involved in multi-copper enzyme maturation permease subunit